MKLLFLYSLKEIISLSPKHFDGECTAALSLLVLDIWIQNNRIYSSALYNTSLTSLI